MFFIVGRGRSGTSLLTKMLNMNPDISIANEGMFLINLHFKYKNKPWNKNTIQGFINDVFLENKMNIWGVDKDYLYKKLLNTPSLTYATACSAVYEAVNIKKSKPVLGDKNPHYSLFIPRLMKLFPTAKFIFMIRDYRDNILSYQDVHFDLNNTAALAFRWLFFNKIVYKYMQLFPEKYILIKYEDLIKNPGIILNKICIFLEIEFNEKMLKYYGNNQDLASTRKWHKKLNKPLDTGNINKWQAKMALPDLITAEKICSGFAEKFGYSRSTGNKVCAFKLLYGKILAVAFLILEKIYFWVPLKPRILLRNRFRKK